MSTTPTMEDVKRYANERYPRWLDHAQYHCIQQGIPDEANDVLNEVLASIFAKDEDYVIKLYSKPGKGKKGEVYTELDFYVLRMIRLNSYSPTSPYQSKYKKIKKLKISDGIDLSRLDIEDLPMDKRDDPAEELRHYQLVMWVRGLMNLTALESAVFEHRFVLEEPGSNWPGPENKRVYYETYNRLKSAIQTVLFSLNLTGLAPVLNVSSITSKNLPHPRIIELIDSFFLNKAINNRATAA